MLNIRHLQIFRTVVKTGSVTGAARVLYISQPAVTKALRLLEEEINLTLFHRQGGRLVCTAEAEALLPEVERLFGSMDTVEQTATEIRHGLRGRVTIAASSTIAISVLSHAIGRFYANHPLVSVDVRALPTRHVVEYVNTNQADMGVLDVPAPTGALQVEDFWHSEIVSVMRKDHPFAARKVLTPEDLEGQPLVSFGEETMTSWHLREAFRSRDIPFQVTFATNSTITACSIVAEVNGIALVDPFTLLSGAFPQLVVRRFEPKTPVHPRFLFSSRPRSLIVSEFVKQAMETIKDLDARLHRMIR